MSTPTTGAAAGRTPGLLTQLACPKCASTDLASVEELTAAGRCHTVGVRDDGTLEFDWTGWTEVDWNTSRTIGVQCETCAHHDIDGNLADIAGRFSRVAGGAS